MTEVALIAGAGPGLGAALARRFAASGMRVAIAARRRGAIETLAREVSAETGGTLEAFALDVTDEAAVDALFAHVRTHWEEPTLVVYNAGAYLPAGILDTSAADFERCWKVGCQGGFLVGKEAVRGMLRRGGGTLLFPGATASLRGSARFANLAVGKFGLRALAQCMAREFGPKGIHVGHVVIDGGIREHDDPRASPSAPHSLLEPDAIAEAYYQLHLQPRSAWTLELDLRPWVERF